MPTPRRSRWPFADRLCAVIATPSAREALEQIQRARKDTKTLELRLDWLRSDQERAKLLESLKNKRRSLAGMTLLATCRRILGGGKLAGGAEAELYWLTQARAAGCQWCDLEMETLREMPGQSARAYPLPAKILLSFHDFHRTPALPVKLDHARRGEADACKIAVQARTIGDSLRALRLVRESRDMVAVP